MVDIAIIGGGAAGLCAALCAAQAGANNITVFEQLDRVGKKIAITGNGRCNITNKNLSPDRFYSQNAPFVKEIFRLVSHTDIIDFFEDLGVLFFTETDGRQYPASLQAASVTDALRFECEQRGVTLCCNSKVTGIKAAKDKYLLSVDGNTVTAKSVILACGALAGGQKLGCDGTGFNLALGLGHTKTPLYPAIVQLRTENRIVRQLKGIKVDAFATLFDKGKAIRREFGEILFCDYGLSGPPILQLSSLAKQGCEISLDLMESYSLQQLVEVLKARAYRFSNRPLGEFFTGMLNKRLGQVVIKELGLSLNEPSCLINEQTAKHLAEKLKSFSFTVTGDNGHIQAQATLGGLKTNEFNVPSLESKIHKGLFCAGEILDVCGDCGGYNLSFAWASGMLAGKGAAKYVSR